MLNKRSMALGAKASTQSATSSKAALVHAFEALDTNGDGSLDFEELAVLLRRGNSQITDEQIRILFDRADTSRCQKIWFPDFVDLLFDSKKQSLPQGAAELVHSFQALDTDNDGSLDLEELRVLLKRGDPKISDVEIEVLYSNADKDDDGKILFSEFVEFVFNYRAYLPPGISLFEKGEAVHVRNGDADWAIGTVTSVSPLLITPDGGTHGVTFHSDSVSKFQDYTSVQPLKTAIKSGDTLFLKGHWLQRYAETLGILPKRQDLSAKAFWSRDELMNNINESGDLAGEGITVVALSYCWATPAHPDPTGEQLRRLSVILKKFLLYSKRIAIFIDWCSLYQNERSDQELTVFVRALANVNLWYSHQLTWVWLLTRVPDGVRPYMDRGWPTFERAIGMLIKDSSMLLDIGVPLPDKRASRTCKALVQTYTSVRKAPLTPEAFNEQLATKTVTNGMDIQFLKAKYKMTLEEVLTSAEELDYSNLKWDDVQACRVLGVLPSCRKLAILNLEGNSITDLGPILNRMRQHRSLKLIRLRGNAITTLDFLPGDADTFGMLREIDLSGNSLIQKQLESMTDCLHWTIIENPERSQYKTLFVYGEQKFGLPRQQ